jgi:hypothetical protein
MAFGGLENRDSCVAPGLLPRRNFGATIRNQFPSSSCDFSLVVKCNYEFNLGRGQSPFQLGEVTT